MWNRCWAAVNVIPIPDHVSFDEAATLDCLAVCVHAVRRADVHLFESINISEIDRTTRRFLVLYQMFLADDMNRNATESRVDTAFPSLPPFDTGYLGEEVDSYRRITNLYYVTRFREIALLKPE